VATIGVAAEAISNFRRVFEILLFEFMLLSLSMR